MSSAGREFETYQCSVDWLRSLCTQHVTANLKCAVVTDSVRFLSFHNGFQLITLGFPAFFHFCKSQQCSDSFGLWQGWTIWSKIFPADWATTNGTEFRTRFFCRITGLDEEQCNTERICVQQDGCADSVDDRPEAAATDKFTRHSWCQQKCMVGHAGFKNVWTGIAQAA